MFRTITSIFQDGLEDSENQLHTSRAILSSLRISESIEGGGVCRAKPRILTEETDLYDKLQFFSPL